MRRAAAWLGSLGLLACTLDTGGADSGMANTLGNSDSNGSGSMGSTNGDDDTDAGEGPGSGGADSASTTDDPPDTDDPPPDDAPSLSISHGPEHDFGNVALGMLGNVMLTVTNDGSAEATGMMGQPLSAGPFVYTGDTYPGAGGTCSDTLGPTESCIIDVSFVPGELGLHDDTLVVSYTGGPDATRDLHGAGTGKSDNLLNNPGGEQTGTPPPGWTDDGPGTWTAGESQGVTPAADSYYLYADGYPFDPSRLIQDVPTAQWAATIDRGQMRFIFDGQARTLPAGGDNYRFIVRYLDGSGTTLDDWTSDWQSSDDWELMGTEGTAPVGTRIIRVELGCGTIALGSCDAYFDALHLFAAYP